MLVIGLTGGIGTGKSTVSGMLAHLGAVILNADLVGHEAYLPRQNVWQEVMEAFGHEVLNERDEVDRAKLGAAVFKDPEALKRLNAIVHPWMYRRMEQLLGELRSKGTKVAVLEAALLFEAGWKPLVDEVWMTFSSEENVIRRLGDRNGLAEEQVRQRMRAQLPAEERIKGADLVVNTDGTIDEVREVVRRLWQERVEAVR